MQENTQVPIKSIANQSGSHLEVHSIFYTIQGEGPFAGHPAIFVRLGGCNLQCPGCDTEYSKDVKTLAFGRVVEHIEAVTEACKLVVITGGEPFRQNIAPLVRSLLAFGYKVQIETNGTLPPSGTLGHPVNGLHVVCSPKTGKVNQKLLPVISAYKYVAKSEDISIIDGLPIKALGHSAAPQLARPHHDFKGPVYLQAMDEQNKDLNLINQVAVVESCKIHGHILCLQMHKIIGVE